MSGLPHHKLALKIDTPIMCLRNVDQRGGLCNGNKFQVLRMRINNIEAKITSGGKLCEVLLNFVNALYYGLYGAFHDNQ